MALWTSTDGSAGAPKFGQITPAFGSSANGLQLYANTQTGAFVTGAAVGVFGVDTTEQTVSLTTANKAAHAGWVLRETGMGGIATISAGATNKSNVGNAFITFTGGGTGNTSANAQIFVNATTNVVTSIVLNDAGLYESAPTGAVAGNANVTITLTMGGRVGRVQTEVLVAMGSMTSDGADDTIYADS
jgi:hypothetical protein